jgi:hypothetical protein
MVPVNEDQSIALVRQSEHGSRLLRCGRPRSVSHAEIGRDLDQLGIASREAWMAALAAAVGISRKTIPRRGVGVTRHSIGIVAVEPGRRLDGRGDARGCPLSAQATFEGKSAEESVGSITCARRFFRLDFFCFHPSTNRHRLVDLCTIAVDAARRRQEGDRERRQGM